VVLQVDVEQVDVPRQFDIVRHVGFDDLPGDGQRRLLRRIVNVAVAGALKLLVLLGEKSLAQFSREPVARVDANFGKWRVVRVRRVPFFSLGDSRQRGLDL
jgi:hypothetical protein